MVTIKTFTQSWFLLVLLHVFGISSEADASCKLEGSSLTDVEAIKANCTDIVIGDFIVPAGQTLDLSNLTEGSTVTFEGTTTFEYYNWVGPLIRISGNKIRVTGASGHVIDGNGSVWWDGLGDTGGESKPKVFYFTYMSDSIVENLYVINAAKHCFTILYDKNVTFTGITLDNRDGDTEDGGHNTDAFDIGDSEDIYIYNNTVYNQDDCLAVNSGKNIYFSNNYCSGGHGISIGSVGNRTNNVVQDVSISNCHIVNSENGVRIKTKSYYTGLVTGITYTNITLANITDAGITIRADYYLTGDPTGGIPIYNFTLNNIHGTVLSSGYNVYVLVVNASNWSWNNIAVTGGKGDYCVGMPEGTGYTCSSHGERNKAILFMLVLSVLAMVLSFS